MKPNSNPSISDELCWDFFVGGDFVLSIFRMEEQWYNLNNLIEEGGTHMTERTYLAIDLKSFYASVECMERGLDPMTTVPFPVSWTVKMKKKQKETQDILSYHTQAAGCSDKARAKASGGRQPIEECGRTGL